MYAIQVQRLERQVLAGQQVAAILAAAGAKDVPFPLLGDALAEFDRVLAADIPVVDEDRAELLEALGVHA